MGLLHGMINEVEAERRKKEAETKEREFIRKTREEAEKAARRKDAPNLKLFKWTVYPSCGYSMVCGVAFAKDAEDVFKRLKKRFSDDEYDFDLDCIYELDKGEDVIVVGHYYE